MKPPPTIEGKAARFKQFGDAEGQTVVLDTRDSDSIVEIVRGGITRRGHNTEPRRYLAFLRRFR